ncbi:hypothetical protein [Bacillus cereus]|uniref:hypothetical protein n=1 Tax=Bacillus cereus TaxID=1396 RepID=UPI000BFCE2AB|nr:hypothetical protein [Bacillus cereus]PGZ12843.1 hypothetical protein COE46_22625 [Bacillus cereus]
MKKGNFFYLLQIYASCFLIVSCLCIVLENNMFTKFILLISGILFLIGSFFSNDDRINILVMFFLVSRALQIFPDVAFVESNLVPLFVIFMTVKVVIYNRAFLKGMRYLSFIVVFFVIIILSAFNASDIFQQSYLDSIIPNRNYIVLLAYIPLLVWFRKGYNLEKLLVTFTLIASCLYIFQYVMVDQIKFLSFTIQERMGDRLRLSHPIIYFGALVSLNYFIVNFSKKLNYKWVGLLSYVTTIFLVLFVNQTRSIFFALVISGLAIFILSKIQFGKKVKIATGILFLLLVSAPLYIEQINGILESSIYELNNSAGNIEVRNVATNYYVQLGTNTPFLGHGFINLRTNSASFLLSGLDQGLFWVDIGIYGLFFLHGLFGVTWYLAIIAIIMLNTKIIIRQQRTYIFAAAIYNIVTITLFADFYSFLFGTAFCLAALTYMKTDKGAKITSEVV